MPLKRTSGTNDFHEVQHFNQWWALAVVEGLALAGWWAFVEQIVMGKPWGNNPAPDAVVLIMWLVFGIGLPVMMRWVRLIVRVTEGTLDVRYVPFRHRVIPLSTITSATPRTYRPLRDYFGWGIRWVPLRGWVYSVSGDQGVQLVLGGRRKLLIGSRKPTELAAAIVSNQTPNFDGPNDSDLGEDWTGDDDQFDGRDVASEEEPLFETSNDNGHIAAKVRRWSMKGPAKGAGTGARMGARLLLLARRARGAFFPAIGGMAGWIQGIARRLGASDRVQRFAANPKEQASLAAERAVSAGKEAGVRARRAGVLAGNEAAQRIRNVHVPSRVAEPAMRYMRNPQLIVDDFKKTA